MPTQEKRVRRRQRGAGVLTALIVCLTLVAVVLTFLLIHSDPLNRTASAPLPTDGDVSGFVEQRGATIAPLVLGASAAPEATPMPTDAPQVSVAPDETPAADDAEEADIPDSQRLTPTVRPGDYFLPIYDRALRTPDDAAMIAITIDRCNSAEVMSQMVSIARQYDAKLTLFPTGEALMTPGLTNGFRTCVRSLGYELENYSYSHKAEYRLSDGELAIQLWKQSIAASYALGGDYQQHFYRPYSIYSVGDQRTHFYIRKLGQLGVAGYTHSYRDYSVDALLATLENGNIYQFDMSEKSLAAFEALIAEANRKGYRMVTMNQLFGLEENSLSDRLTIDEQTLPELNDYEPTYYDLKLNDRTHAVYDLQAQLMALGYLTGEDVKADGIYGPTTSVAVSVYQAEAGFPATGNATAETQSSLAAAAADSVR